MRGKKEDKSDKSGSAVPYVTRLERLSRTIFCQKSIPLAFKRDSDYTYVSYKCRQMGR